MADRTYSELYGLVEALAGVDSFTSSEQTSILAFANRRLYQAYAASPVWPSYITTGQARPIEEGILKREYTDSTDNVANYGLASVTRVANVVTAVCDGPVVLAPGMKYSCFDTTGTVSVASGGSLTITSITTTTLEDDTVVGTVETTNTGSETYSLGGSATLLPVSVPAIEVFFRVYDGNPRSKSAVVEYAFDVDSNGANLYGTFDGTEGCYATYKKAWDGLYTTSSTNIPQEFFYYAAHATYADFLRMDGQIDKAMAEEQNAQQYLIIEIDRVESQANNNMAYSRFTTYTSQSSR